MYAPYYTNFTPSLAVIWVQVNKMLSGKNKRLTFVKGINYQNTIKYHNHVFNYHTCNIDDENLCR